MLFLIYGVYSCEIMYDVILNVLRKCWGKEKNKTREHDNIKKNIIFYLIIRLE